jgi:hypothetical protein
MKTRNIPKQFLTLTDLGFKNLLVGGCSFTYNNSDQHSCTWPYYLRDLGNFEQVYDCSMPGAGNQHIVNSIIYSIEKHDIDPSDTLVMILWSGNDRDDYVIDQKQLNGYPYVYAYEPGVCCGITGGEDLSNVGNTKLDAILQLKSSKSQVARSVENYIRVAGLHAYLVAKGFTFFFMEFRDFLLPGRDLNFDPRLHLDQTLGTKFDQMISKPDHNFHKYCLYNDLMSEDDFHPSPDGHLSYSRSVLLPWIANKLGKHID